MARFNLLSPVILQKRCDFENLESWLKDELLNEKRAIRSVVGTVVRNLPDFVSWPATAVLLWQGCDRIKPAGKPVKYHKFPKELQAYARERKIRLDGRPNGPAVASFLLAGGLRPKRDGSSNGWSIHHLYSGKYPYPGKTSTLHAQKDGSHFTQSAGLVAVHPIADGMCDEFPAFAWLLRAHAFNRFGYDPDAVFARKTDALGFASKSKSAVQYVCSSIISTLNSQKA